MSPSFRNTTFLVYIESKTINLSSAGSMKFKGFLLNVSFLWVEGMALFPFILSKNKLPGRRFINHECIHLKQQLEMGLVFFYIWYFVEYLLRLIVFRNHLLAYYNISFEREAYGNEANPEYLENRRLWAFLKYLSAEK